MKRKNLLCLLLVLIMMLTFFSGCGSSSDEADAAEAETESAETTEEAYESGESEEAEEASESVAETSDSSSALPDSYPLLCDDGSITLSMFQIMIPFLTDIEDFNELYWWQQLSERTGVTFDWNMIPIATASDQFNLLIAADDLPNIICMLNYYSESITYGVENDIFVDLSYYVEDYAPDYWDLISQEDVYPIVSDENGSMIAFYELGYEDSLNNNGVVVRGDLLEEQGLDVPVTYDEYEDALLALKTAYDLEAPIYMNADSGGDGWLASGMYVQYDLTLDAEGNVIYGPIEDAYRDYLKIASRWYEEGLFNENFYVESATSGDEAIEYLSAGKSVLGFMDGESIPNVDLTESGGYLVPGHMPRVNEDDQIHLTSGITNKVNTSVGWMLGARSTEDEIQSACMLINYFYTEEGSLFAGYGVEGVTFEYQEDGTPWYTELITDNPDGLSQTQSVVHHLGNNVPSLTDFAIYNISVLTYLDEFVDVWGEADNTWAMPQVTLTIEESEEYSAVATDVETYLDETLMKFIRGDMDINDDAVWQEYLDTLDALGVNTMIEIYQAALNRFNAR